MLSEKDLREIERIVSLPREEFLSHLTPQNRRNYLESERRREKSYRAIVTAIQESERNIDYSLIVF